MAALGYDDVYYTNAVKCYPSAAYPADRAGERDPEAGPDADGENREPTVEERASCRPYLREEVERVAPEAVVATGSHATRSLLAVEGREVESFLDLVCEVLACPTLGAPVVPVLHPSYREVWISRLGHSAESYREAVGEAIRRARTREIGAETGT